MSGTDPTPMINANHGNLAPILADPSVSLWIPKAWATTNIFAYDNANTISPMGTQANFGGVDRFRINKRGGRIHKMWLELDITAGVVAAANRAAYIDDMSACIADLRMDYASKTIQQYQADPLKNYWHLMIHDLFREHYNAMVYAGLPPGAVAGKEAIREANVSAAFTVYIPLSWLFNTRHEDYSLNPEGLASELELVVTYNTLAQLVYARVIATGLTPAGSPFTTAPTISAARLRTQLIFPPVIEKNIALTHFEQPQGVTYKILDFEAQTNNSIALGAGTYKVALSNFRLDSQFIMFYMRSSLINTAYAVDRNSSDTTATILPGGGSVAAMQAITSFRLIANGATLVDSQTDIFNRALMRSVYLPGGQVGHRVYFIPFSWNIRDSRNVSGFQNMANLGNVELEVVVPVRSEASVLDVYSIAHNVVQQKKADISKVLR